MIVKKMPSFIEDAQQLNRTIDDALRYYDIPHDVTLSVLKKWINETNSPVMFINRVFDKAHFESEVEAEKLLDLLTRLWNVTPRSELNGMSPQQKLASNLGPHNTHEG